MKLEKFYLQGLGLRYQGDLGPWTIFNTRRGQGVVFVKAPPRTPPSYYQIRQRNRFRRAMFHWNQLTLQEKQSWENATKIARLRMSGVALFNSAYCNPEPLRLQNLATRTGQTLTQPED